MKPWAKKNVDGTWYVQMGSWGSSERATDATFEQYVTNLRKDAIETLVACEKMSRQLKKGK